MDDRDLEGRLRAHLHQRLDSAEPSPDLGDGVAQLFATERRPVGLAALLSRLPAPGRSLALAASVIVAVAIVGAIAFRPAIGPGGPTAPPSQGPPGTGQRSFVVVPSSGASPSKAEGTLASDVLDARIRALGVWNFTSSVGYGYVVVLPPDGAADDAVRHVLGAPGDVAFVPLPPADYREGGFTASVGQPLPKDEPVLFGWEGISSIALSSTDSGSAIDVTLKPAASDAFTAFTEAHVSATFAVVVDGVVAVLPTINEPISGDKVTINGGGDDHGAFAQAAAILVGGMLPESWRGSAVPAVITADAAIDAAVSEYPADGVDSVELNVINAGPGLRAVWNVVLTGDFPGECPTVSPPRSACPSAPTMLVVLDAITGAAISTVAPAD